MQVHAAAITNKLNEQNKTNRNEDNKHHDVDSDNCCITAATEVEAAAAQLLPQQQQKATWVTGKTNNNNNSSTINCIELYSALKRVRERAKRGRGETLSYVTRLRRS